MLKLNLPRALMASGFVLLLIESYGCGVKTRPLAPLREAPKTEKQSDTKENKSTDDDSEEKKKKTEN